MVLVSILILLQFIIYTEFKRRIFYFLLFDLLNLSFQEREARERLEREVVQQRELLSELAREVVRLQIFCSGAEKRPDGGQEDCQLSERLETTKIV